VSGLLDPDRRPSAVPPERRGLTIGDHVEAAFRLFDVLPFAVRSDLARLIFLYMHDPGAYDARKRTLLATPPTEKVEGRANEEG
jgi:hypothetical protein